MPSAIRKSTSAKLGLKPRTAIHGLNREEDSALSRTRTARQSMLPPAAKMPPYAEAKAREGWEKFNNGLGEMSIADLVGVLFEVGFTRPEPSEEQVSALCKDMFGECSFVDKSTFMEFVCNYHTRYWENIKAEMSFADTNRNGRICVAEMADLLYDVNISPLPSLVKELHDEVTGSTDADVELDAGAFVRLLDLIEDRAGFPAQQYEELMKLYRSQG